MAKTYQEVEALTHAAAAEITKSPDRWMVFLDTAARMYRYSFQEQMLIHAQRPDATACASFDLWRQRFNRAVMRGHKGIALIDETASRPKLKYVFDVSDTVKRYGGTMDLDVSGGVFRVSILIYPNLPPAKPAIPEVTAPATAPEAGPATEQRNSML